MCGRDGTVVSTVLLVQSFEFGRYWYICCRPQTSFLETKTIHILRSLRGAHVDELKEGEDEDDEEEKEDE